jgi:hypothetical protein
MGGETGRKNTMRKLEEIKKELIKVQQQINDLFQHQQRLIGMQIILEEQQQQKPSLKVHDTKNAS